MNRVLRQLMEGAADADAFVRSVASHGLRSVSGVWRGSRLFGALDCAVAEGLERDETHYVLVPLPGAGSKPAVYTKRVLPPGTGAANSLPKARIFHVPSVSARADLERGLVESRVGAGLSEHAAGSELADALENLADQIDRETGRMSGGLLLVGGAVALVNPLLGVGIAANGLLPSLGAKASKVGAGYLGGKLRGLRRSSLESKLRKEATVEVRKLKPMVLENPLLKCLDAVLSDPAGAFDPYLDQRAWIDAFEVPAHHAVAAEAIGEVYRGLGPEVVGKLRPTSHRDWVAEFVSAASRVD